VNLYEFIWIYVNYGYEFIIYLYMDQKKLCGSARHCGSESGVSRSAAVQAMRAAVRGSAPGSVRAERVAVVCGCALGSVWQCAQQCAAVRQSGIVRGGDVRLPVNAALCGSVWQCTRLCAAVYAAVCAAVCGSVRSSVRGSVWQCARQCAAIRQCAR
jgi:hypothetical protein